MMIGTGEWKISSTISRVESIRPPGVLRRTIRAAAFSRCAELRVSEDIARRGTDDSLHRDFHHAGFGAADSQRGDQQKDGDRGQRAHGALPSAYRYRRAPARIFVMWRIKHFFVQMSFRGFIIAVYHHACTKNHHSRIRSCHPAQDDPSCRPAQQSRNRGTSD